MIDFKNGALFKLKRDKNAKVGQVEDLLIEGETVIGSYTMSCLPINGSSQSMSRVSPAKSRTIPLFPTARYKHFL